MLLGLFDCSYSVSDSGVGRLSNSRMGIYTQCHDAQFGVSALIELSGAKTQLVLMRDSFDI